MAARGYSGVALLVRAPCAGRRRRSAIPPFDLEHRIVVADLGALRVASVYVPNGGKNYEQKVRFLEALVAWCAATRAPAPLLLCGDLNVAREERDVHPKLRKANQIGTRPEERAFSLNSSDGGLADVGRALDPGNDELFTWWAPWRNLRQRNIGWRIDYVLAGEPLASRAASPRVDARVRDQRPRAGCRGLPGAVRSWRVGRPAGRMSHSRLWRRHSLRGAERSSRPGRP